MLSSSHVPRTALVFGAKPTSKGAPPPPLFLSNLYAVQVTPTFVIPTIRLPNLQHARPIACLNCSLPFLKIEGPETPNLHARLTWQGPCLRHTPAPHILVLGELGTTWKAKWQACPQRTLLSCFCCRCRWHGYPAPPQLPAASAQSPFRPISPLKAATMTIERALLSLSSHCTWCWCRR